MKKLYLVLLACSLFIVCDLPAQITIDQSDFPTAGEIWVELGDSRYGMHTLTPGGANQTWNYANAFVVDDTTILGWINPLSTPPQWASNYPNANLAFWDVLDSTAIYCRSATDGFYVDGSYDLTGAQPLPSIDFDPDLLLVPTPFTYNSTRTHVSGFSVEQPAAPPTPGILYKLTTIHSFEGDGYGSLSTPAGSYPNVLRIRGFEYNIDSTFIDTIGSGNYTFLNTSGPQDTSITYRWMKKGANTTLMVISEDPHSPGTTMDTYYFDPSIVGMHEINTSINTLNVYPNPAMNNQLWITFDIESQNAEMLNIYDMNGRLVRKEYITGMNTFKMNTSAFENGVYNCEISGTKMSPVRSKLIIQ